MFPPLVQAVIEQHSNLTLIVLMWRIGWAHINARK